MTRQNGIDRRHFLKSAGLGLGVLAIGPGMSIVAPARAQDKTRIVIKLDWLMSNGQIGDVMALKHGFFEEAGFEVEFSPGGPNSATVPPVISGAAALGQFSETPQLFNARASGVPVKILACGFRTGPYAFASLPKKPLRSIDDLPGMKIGIQPTGRFLLDAILAKNEMDPSSVTAVNVGFDKAPLLRGEVDAIGGWITNTEALSIIGDDRIDLLASDLGLPSYANVYFATDDAIEKNADVLAGYVGAAAKGWGWTFENPQEAVKQMVEAYPALSLEWEMKTIDKIMELSFDAATAENGWATFDPASLEEQLSLYDRIGQYPNGRPKLEDVYTTKILEMTADLRPRIG